VHAERFDVKHSAGGMMDVEFAVQFLVLTQGSQHPPLLANAGNIALLHRAQAAGLLPDAVGSRAADAYRDLCRAKHQARLDEQTTQLEDSALQAQRAAVLALWRAVFD
jgi:[glutamine synthetase] adenylyltransferase / [glutamine synthetase]-adenylyl-L-tyrosine phosphorylase